MKSLFILSDCHSDMTVKQLAAQIQRRAEVSLRNWTDLMATAHKKQDVPEATVDEEFIFCHLRSRSFYSRTEA